MTRLRTIRFILPQWSSIYLSLSATELQRWLRLGEKENACKCTLQSTLDTYVDVLFPQIQGKIVRLSSEIVLGRFGSNIQSITIINNNSSISSTKLALLTTMIHT